jgi:DHA1 family bicyclomycin/chloramphenicol resistance-like MFS transporter
VSEPGREKHGRRLLATLSVLLGFASISTDLYLPALPAMAEALRAGPGEMEWTISSYLIGFSLGQLIWGPVGDTFGRRGPVAVGLVIFAIGSAGCALSASAGQIIGWRVAQALGACAAVVLSRAMIRDLYHGDRAAQMLSTLMTVMAVAPLLGPFVGGQILAFAFWPFEPWRAIFWTLVATGLLTLAALAKIPETLPLDRRNKGLRTAFVAYGGLLGQKKILGYAAAGACLYAGVFAYIAGAPFAYIGVHHVAPEKFGLLFGLGIVAIMAANMLNVRLIPRFGGARLLRAGALGAALSGMVLAFDALTGFGGLAGLVAPLVAYNGATGFIVANSVAGAMSAYPDRAGAVSALVGALQYGAGILGAGLVGLLADGTPWPMGLAVALSGVGCALFAWTMVAVKRAD